MEKNTQENYKKLLSTQRLPVIEKVLEGNPPFQQTQQFPEVQKTALDSKNPKYIVCKGCHNTFLLPPEMIKGHVRCRICGTAYRVGVPSEYIRISCICGKLLTVLKKYEGQKGRCPNCGKVLQVPFVQRDESNAVSGIVRVGIPSDLVRIACPCGKILTAPKSQIGQKGRCRSCKRILTIAPLSPESQTAPVASTKLEELEKGPSPSKETHPLTLQGPIHFQCSCGQHHMVEGERAKNKIICFRCGKEIEVPLSEERKQESLEPFPTIGMETWHIQTPYMEENLFSILGLEKDCSVLEIKQACRRIQAHLDRHDPSFQKAQIAKDILSHPEKRLRYEILNEKLLLAWKELTKKKWLKLHDLVLEQHQEAIEKEKQRLYYKADSLWNNATENWLKLVKENSFWEAALQRGVKLFEIKCKPEMVEQIRQNCLNEVLVSVGCQFYERYRAENNQVRSQQYRKSLIPVLRYLFQNDRANLSIKNLLLNYYYNEIKFLADQELWDKTGEGLLELRDTFPHDPEVRQWIEEFFPLMEPFLSPGKRTKIANLLEVKI